MRKWLAVSCMVVLGLVSAELMAADESEKQEPKTISGMSIVGNDEAPKSLFIVPWKSSEIGFESGLTAQGLLDGSLRPIDKEVLNRELDYFEIRSSE
ncbi:hypothetical protein G8770_03215 [Aestuariicella hydrocarbonica]|uniref:Uncharacterized protein n=2 Tax=Pseudomaricurvus hydrocarbonicus TaxID=1470433 RepID=A0A9E5JU45_9GAMM|nr:hypothetical protein [Aestuariicella hydrocarbonica]